VNDEDVMIANDIVENTIAGAFQLDPPTQNRVIQAMNRHILAGNMLKARQAAHGSAVAPVSDGRIQVLLRGKYPAAAADDDDDLPADPPIDIDAQEIRAQLINLPRLYVEDSDSLMSYIMLKCRGASVGLNGFSNDYNQDKVFCVTTLIPFTIIPPYNNRYECEELSISSLLSGTTTKSSSQSLSSSSSSS
jgi:hypothetical protein